MNFISYKFQLILFSKVCPTCRHLFVVIFFSSFLFYREKLIWIAFNAFNLVALLFKFTFVGIYFFSVFSVQYVTIMKNIKYEFEVILKTAEIWITYVYGISNLLCSIQAPQTYIIFLDVSDIFGNLIDKFGTIM